MEKNGNIISLSQQSIGFKWFFNFFFNFLYVTDLQAGDIVLMDEPDAHLAIPAKRELRRFIKGFAKSTGITFIVTTQHPDFIDPNFLDELRIIKHKRATGEVGAKIQNDFSVIDEDADDTINEILVAFGVYHRDIITNLDNKVIYVEGLTDYNYLTAFKLLKEYEEDKKIGLAFLPIGGLGVSEEKMKKKLSLLAKRNGSIVLTDSDDAGKRFKEIWEADMQVKDKPYIFQLEEADASFKMIENLFSEGDKNKYNLNPENKHKGAASTLFKRKMFNLLDELKDIKEPKKKEEAIKKLVDTETKGNFYKLLNGLAGMSGATENSV